MKLAVIVTEFPKATETFIYRDLTAFKQAGVDLQLHHVAPFRHDQTLHGFARHLLADARYSGFLSAGALASLVKTAIGQPRRLVRTIADVCKAYARHPKILAKSLLIIPKALQFARQCRADGVDHVHAEFAGHPATMAWIAHRFGGPAYSVSCRAHDIFRTQALLAEKLGEAKGVRTVSDYGRTFLKSKLRNGSALDIDVIHSSVDTAAIAAPAVQIDPEQPRLLYVGALEPKKGVEYLLEALAIISDQLADWRLDIIGGGPSEHALKARSAELGLAQRVTFRGSLPFEEVAEAYHKAALCLCPSVIGPSGRMEGIPNVVIEAMAYRRPVIATGISGIPELITHEENGLMVPQRDSKALGNAILAVFSDPASSAAMAERGREKVVAEFDLRRNAARQLTLFGAPQELQRTEIAELEPIR